MTETITTILCIGLLSIYRQNYCGCAFSKVEAAEEREQRKAERAAAKAKREEEREKRDLEYHEMRMKEFKQSTAVGGGSDPAALYGYAR